jgi:hypothetical protein
LIQVQPLPVRAVRYPRGHWYDGVLLLLRGLFILPITTLTIANTAARAGSPDRCTRTRSRTRPRRGGARRCSCGRPRTSPRSIRPGNGRAGSCPTVQRCCAACKPTQKPDTCRCTAAAAAAAAVATERFGGGDAAAQRHVAPEARPPPSPARTAAACTATRTAVALCARACAAAAARVIYRIRACGLHADKAWRTMIRRPCWTR